jgi:hypothetical protein
MTAFHCPIGYAAGTLFIPQRIIAAPCRGWLAFGPGRLPPALQARISEPLASGCFRGQRGPVQVQACAHLADEVVVGVGGGLAQADQPSLALCAPPELAALDLVAVPVAPCWLGEPLEMHRET